MKEKDYIKDLSEIRTMMENASRFISLSGLSGVFAGFYALGGAYVAYDVLYSKYEFFGSRLLGDIAFNDMAILILDMAIVFLAAIITGIFFTTRKAKKKGLKIWDRTTRKLLINLAIPLMAGGVFCITLVMHGAIGLVAPATLVFYGLALINASKYTLHDIRYLGISELVLGLIASFSAGYGLIFWSLGFGLLHIIYGLLMYFKYER
jgi:hypothetical protein